VSDEQQQFTFDGWAIFEAMGHIKRAGKVRVSQLGGNAVFVVRSESAGGETVEEVFAAGSLYRLTPCTQEAARLIAPTCNPSPVELLGVPYRVQQAMRQIEREEQAKAQAIEAGTAPAEDAPPPYRYEPYDGDGDDDPM
jgi:hypothetical protein